MHLASKVATDGGGDAEEEWSSSDGEDGEDAEGLFEHDVGELLIGRDVAQVRNNCAVAA